MNQTIKPDKIILWLCREECQGIQLPKELLRLEKIGLTIRYVDENLMGHKKLLYAKEEYPDDLIITVDDDVVYSRKLVEKLYNGYKEHPDCVCCNMAHKITIEDGMPQKYDNWVGGTPGLGGVSSYFLALGVGGILYPPDCFDKEYFCRDLIKKLALTADDLWNKIMEIKVGVRVYKVNKSSKALFVIIGTQKKSLGQINNGQKKNDEIIRSLCGYYKINWRDL